MTKRLILAALTALLFAPVAGAQVFHDLPGVVTTEEHEAEDQVFCAPHYIPAPENSTKRHWGRTVYNCTRGGVTSSGSNLPLSRERSLRGYDW
ncbi:MULTISPECIES: hypothetical protein [Shinella]|jgi:hypothetical protein|uniref:Uncharacterized protein n=1 Tax=Shinella granuli TaxID=323621 RepID=A0A4R2CEH9_SHIGR|nr:MULTISPECIES: hypothetical protein [Shinella]ANH02820.1 hypothetical protein shn_01415 [Shinella sp. HZN7]TCN38555.1 hypothetical protein EV665_11968 [Shinella granuli]